TSEFHKKSKTWITHGTTQALKNEQSKATTMIDDRRPSEQIFMLPEPSHKTSQLQAGDIADHSRVVRGKMGRNSVAIKACRRPDIPMAANMWWRKVQALRIFGEALNSGL
ncbi:hypothetical protein LTR46_012015, partial [Exophiala xenobiotica]